MKEINLIKMLMKEFIIEKSNILILVVDQLTLSVQN